MSASPVRSSRRALLLSVALLLSACGGGGGDTAPPAGAGGSSTPDGPSAQVPVTGRGPVANEPARERLNVLALQLAQTHVLPESGRRWEGQAAPIGDEELHLIGNRSALALVRLAAAGDIVGPAIEGWLGDRRLGSLPLADPTQLPPTEDGGSAYGPDWYSATLPAAWLRRGLELRVVADGLASEWRSPAVGADTTLDWRILPFYLFGADESNSGIALDAIGTPAAALREEMALKLSLIHI